MQTITLTRIIPAPIDIVFDEYTDHERLSDLPMAISSKVTTPGRTEKNGLGAVRRLNAAAIQLREEITWITVFTVQLPIIGPRADRAFTALFTVVFKTVLHQVERRSLARAKREGIS